MVWAKPDETEARSAWSSQPLLDFPMCVPGEPFVLPVSLSPGLPGTSLASAHCGLCLQWAALSSGLQGGPSLCLPEFKKTLEEAIRSDTSGHFQRLLISLSQVPFPQERGIPEKEEEDGRERCNSREWPLPRSLFPSRETGMKAQMWTCRSSREMSR